MALAGVVAAADELLELLLHAASSNAAAAAIAATVTEERFDMLSLSFYLGVRLIYLGLFIWIIY